MPRATRQQAEQHRKDIIEAAARLFRERGIDGVSIPDLMAAAGLTHGAFYGHFESKEQLAAVACDRAFEQKREFYVDIASRNAEETAREEFILYYLARRHRDDPGDGCPAPALCADVARKDAKGALRSAFAFGVTAMADRLPSLLSGRKRKLERRETLATISLLVGAVALARATRGSKISDEILAAARETLLGAL